jgi:hypothetical protein
MLLEKEPNCFRNASDALPRLAVLGPVEATVPGRRVRLQRKWLEVLLRLATASGEAVPVDEIFRDVWRPTNREVRREERISVQKAIVGLRATLGRSMIQTDRDARVSAYRLVLDPDQIDFECFSRLIERAQFADSITAADMFRHALGLWRDRPLIEVEHLPFAQPTIDRLTRLREDAMRGLLDAYRDLGRIADALDLAQELVKLLPNDVGLRDLLQRLRSDERRLQRGVVRRTWNDGPQVTVRVLSGDIFAERDACLVVGFSDTFDTDTTDDLVINSGSLQAQVMRVAFDDNPALLDRKLRIALRESKEVIRETRAAKRRGKLVRYAIGTVAVLNYANWRIFALAYGHMGNDLVTRSTRDDIRIALDCLWDAHYAHGQLRPIAIPLIGTGLARVERHDPADLLKLIVQSFVTHSRKVRISPELRVVIRPNELAQIDLADVAKAINAM